MRDGALASLSSLVRERLSDLVVFFGVFALLAAGFSAPARAQAGLVAAYGFNEASGSTTADISGNNNNGTLGSGVSRTTSGKFGGALVFNNSYVTVPHSASLSLTTAMTIEAWVYPTGGSNWATAVMKEQTGQFVYTLYARAPTTPGIYYNVGASERQLNGPTALPLNTWTHLAGTFDGTTSRLYVNGSLVATQTFSGSIATSTGALRIGGNGVWGEYFLGRLDEVRIYNRALAAAEIATDMNTAIGAAAVDVAPPTISITAPTSSLTNASTLTVSGTASDNVGVTQVTWSNNRGGSGTATGTSSWSASGVALQSGDNVITVTARDAANNVASATVTVTLDATVPTVDLTAPGAGATVSGASVTVTASAADNNALAGVQFLLDGAPLGSEVLGTGPTYTFVWNSTGASNGSHTLSARARDVAGNTAQSAGVAVTVSNAAPSGLVAAYAFNEASGSTATDASGFNNSGTLGGGVTRTTSGKYGGALVFSNSYVTVPHAASLNLTTAMTLEAWVYPTANGGYSTALMKEQTGQYVYALYARAPNTPSAEFNAGTTSSSARVVDGTSTLPLNTWSHLAGTFDGTTLRIYVNGAQVASKAASGPIATSTGALRIGGNAVWNEYFTGRIDEVRIYNRALTVAEIATDMNTAIGSTSPPQDVTAPTVAITSPTSNPTYASNSTPLTIGGTASDNVGVTQVTWANNRGGSGTATGTTSWSASGIALQTGDNVITVTARDAANNVSTAATLTVTYTLADATAPTVVISSPTSNSTHLTNATPISVGGTASDNVGVTQVTWTNTATGSTGTATGTTSWSASGIALQPGANPITVEVRDAANNVGTATLTVTLDATVPTINVTAPSDGAAVSGAAVTVTASATDNNTLAGVQFFLDGVAMGSEVLGVGPTYNYTWNTTTASSGSHTITARARDAAGNTTLSAGVSVTVSNVVSGLVAAYGFDETSGTTTSDVSGNNNGGTLGGGVTRTTSGKFGSALVFNNSYVTVPHAASLTLTTGMTIEAWVFPTGGSSYGTVVMKEQPSQFVYSLYSRAPSNPGIYFNVGSAERQLNGPSALPTNTWTHLAGTFDGTTSRLYVNGALVASQNLAGPIAASTGALRIGGNAVWGEYFNGRIDEVRIYNRALAASEIVTDMNTAVGSGGAPVDVTAPTIAITTPTSNPTYATNATPLTISGSSSDNVGVTQVTWTNAATGASGTATGTTSWSVSGIALQTGDNAITVTARDAANNVATATLTATYTIASDVTVPTIAISSPTNSGTHLTNATPLTVSGSASDNVGVTQVTWTNAATGANGTASGTTSWSASGLVLQPGANPITVTARDAANNVASATLTVTLDATVPTIDVTAPGAGTTVSGSSVTVTASAADNNALAGVQFLLDGVAMGSEVLGVGPSYSYAWNTTAATNGSHTLTARARDAAGNTALSAGVSVTVSNTVASGLVAAYAFNETSGTTTTDVSGNNNTGTLGGGVTRTTSGKNAGALVFNNSFVTIPHAASLNLTAGMTIEAWVYPTATGGYATVVMKEKPGALVYTLYGRAPTNPGVHFDVGGTERQLNAPSMLALNTWSHVAGTFDGSMSRLFVNGIEIASQAFAGPISTSTGAVRIGGNAVWGEYFNGRIDDVRIYNRALTAAEVVADMGTPVGDTPIPDTVAPSVNVTAPTAGATVSGTVSLSANASDNVGIASVKFFVDGAQVGAEVSTAPYSTLWNATDVVEGPHTIEAEARDFAGNVKRSAAVPVTVSVPGGATAGLWSGVFSWPVVPIHATLLKTGEVLTWEYDGAGGPYLWNPTTNQFTAVPQPNNLFCGGQTVLADGRLLIAGGHVGAHVGLSLLMLFDPLTRSWTQAPDMATTRWYPTATTLPDGRALITAGETGCSGCNALLPEIYNPLTNQVSTLTGASANFPYYPHMYVLPDGRVFAAATAEEPIISKVLNLSTKTWTDVGQQKLEGGSSVMYLPGKIMKSGTPHDPDLPPDPSTNKTYVIDMNAASPSWTQTAPMAFPRTYHNLTVLPDGNVLVTGGGITSDAVDQAGGVLAAEMWSPATQTYQTLASGSVARLYHSLAILLPDARVLVAGGGRFNGFPSNDPSDHLTAEIYAPPYLFKGARPTITSAPQTAAYGASIAVQSPDVGSVASVSLIRLGAVTHSINMDQRFLPLSFTANGGQLNVVMPANANLAPPGYYMLFLVSSNGVPSKAAIIQIQ